MKMKLKRSIGFKMSVAMAVGLFAVISLFSHTNVRMSEKRLLHLAEDEASKLSSVIKSSLDNAMLGNEETGVQVIIDAVGKESMVRDIKVIDLEAEVKYAKNQKEIGTQLDQSAESCRICHEKGHVNGENLTVIFTDKEGHRVLRNVNPIRNEERCHECHDPESKVLGKLMVDFTTDDIDQMVIDNRQMLILSAAATLVASILLCFLLATILVKRPLRQLLMKMKYAGDEETDAHIEIRGDDEIAIINSTYDSLMNTIDARNRQITQQMDELLALFNVSEILNKSDSIDDNVDLILKALSIGFHVQECAIFTVDGGGNLRAKGAFGMDEEKSATAITCLNRQRDKIDRGQAFIATGTLGVEDFLAVPLKSSGNIVGVITVHTVSDMQITDDELQKSFAIIATSLAPHFQIGLARAERQEMQVSPFNAFITSIEDEIAKVREYFGTVSLALISVQNYNDLSRSRG
ncbi:MAG: hypothetical protein OEV91_11905, partial [Desulfobulbaceae bacterium]|nr:hypothetical protein [Desulfobulbaceae bacterium]